MQKEQEEDKGNFLKDYFMKESVKVARTAEGRAKDSKFCMFCMLCPGLCKSGSGSGAAEMEEEDPDPVAALLRSQTTKHRFFCTACCDDENRYAMSSWGIPHDARHEILVLSKKQDVQYLLIYSHQRRSQIEGIGFGSVCRTR